MVIRSEQYDALSILRERNEAEGLQTICKHWVPSSSRRIDLIEIAKSHRFKPQGGGGTNVLIALRRNFGVE